jgi:hypothetical protein
MANGIDFVIGGKDQAKPAMQSVSQSLGKISNQAEATKSSTDKLAKVTGVLAAAYVAVKGAMAALGGLNAVNAAYDKQTASVKQLTSALKARGDAAQSASLQKLAGDLQKLTGVGDEVSIGLMQQAATMGFATDRIDDAAKAAIGSGRRYRQHAGRLAGRSQVSFGRKLHSVRTAQPTDSIYAIESRKVGRCNGDRSAGAGCSGR